MSVPISYWLLVCTILLALFLGLSKRRHELVLLADDAVVHRPILGKYSPYLLDQMIGIVTASTVMSYILYVAESATAARVGMPTLSVTIPSSCTASSVTCTSFTGAGAVPPQSYFWPIGRCSCV